MTTELAVSGTISIVILVLSVLKRSGALDAGWELLKDRLKRRKENRDVQALVDNVSPPPVSELQSYLDRLDREKSRLDAEFEVVQNFLKKKESA